MNITNSPFHCSAVKATETKAGLDESGFLTSVESSITVFRECMKTFDVPHSMSFYLSDRTKSSGFSESDNYLYGAGNALGFVRMAAFALYEPYSRPVVGEYHAYTGVSAARTAIDAFAVWCNSVLELGLKPGIQVSLTKSPFRNKISKALPEVATCVQALGDLGKEIDDHRQQAQHREGLAIRNKSSRKSPHLNGWYLAPMGLSGDHAADLHLW